VNVLGGERDLFFELLCQFTRRAELDAVPCPLEMLENLIELWGNRVLLCRERVVVFQWLVLRDSLDLLVRMSYVNGLRDGITPLVDSGSSRMDGFVTVGRGVMSVEGVLTRKKVKIVVVK
jgi:hypothetical protein